jgi:hypothetical protein
MDFLLNVALAVVGVFAVLVGLICICGNYVLLYLTARSQHRSAPKSYSLVPIVGPLALSLVWLNVTTIPGTLLWVPLIPWIIDPASWLLAFGLVENFRRIK